MFLISPNWLNSFFSFDSVVSKLILDIKRVLNGSPVMFLSLFGSQFARSCSNFKICASDLNLHFASFSSAFVKLLVGAGVSLGFSNWDKNPETPVKHHPFSLAILPNGGKKGRGSLAVNKANKLWGRNAGIFARKCWTVLLYCSSWNFGCYIKTVDLKLIFYQQRFYMSKRLFILGNKINFFKIIISLNKINFFKINILLIRTKIWNWWNIIYQFKQIFLKCNTNYY